MTFVKNAQVKFNLKFTRFSVNILFFFIKD